jgi:hypothetical protein
MKATGMETMKTQTKIIRNCDQERRAVTGSSCGEVGLRESGSCGMGGLPVVCSQPLDEGAFLSINVTPDARYF